MSPYELIPMLGNAMPLGMASSQFSQLAKKAFGLDPQLNWGEHGFLGLLRGIEPLLAATDDKDATPLGLYNDFISRGRTAPITEMDFKPKEIAAMVEMIRHKGGQSGKIDYTDYPQGPRAPLSTGALGGFSYAVAPGGDINVHDTWNFNRNRAAPALDNNPALLAESLAITPMAMAAKIGRQKMPDSTGIPVNINIPWLY